MCVIVMSEGKNDLKTFIFIIYTDAHEYKIQRSCNEYSELTLTINSYFDSTSKTRHLTIIALL